MPDDAGHEISGRKAVEISSRKGADKEAVKPRPGTPRSAGSAAGLTACGRWMKARVVSEVRSAGNIDAKDTFRILQMSNRRTALTPLAPFFIILNLLKRDAQGPRKLLLSSN